MSGHQQRLDYLIAIVQLYDLSTFRQDADYYNISSKALSPYENVSENAGSYFNY